MNAIESLAAALLFVETHLAHTSVYARTISAAILTHLVMQKVKNRSHARSTIHALPMKNVYRTDALISASVDVATSVIKMVNNVEMSMSVLSLAAVLVV